jgi:hypothetical protein
VEEKAMSKSDGAGGAIALIGIVIIGFICILLVPLTPIAILFVYLKNKSKLKQYDNAESDWSAYWLTAQEQAEFRNLLAEGAAAKEQIRRANRAAAEAGISRNLDGQYNKRSELGKKVHRVIDRSRSTMSDCNSSLNYLSRLPFRRWNSVWGDYPNIAASKMCAGRVFFVWLASVIFYSVYYWQNIWTGIAHTMLLPIEAFNKLFDARLFNVVGSDLKFEECLWGLGITGVTILAAMLFFSLTKKKVIQNMPASPPLATPENYTYGWPDFDRSAQKREGKDAEKSRETASEASALEQPTAESAGAALGKILAESLMPSQSQRGAGVQMAPPKQALIESTPPKPSLTAPTPEGGSRLRFWKGVSSGLAEKASIQTPSPGDRSNLDVSLGRTGFFLSNVLPQDGTMAVRLLLNGKGKDELFQELLADRKKIETTMGGALTWSKPNDARKIISVTGPSLNLDKDADLTRAVAWMVDWIAKFNAVFEPRVRNFQPR